MLFGDLRHHFIGQGTCFYNFDVDKARGTKVALRTMDTAGQLSAPGPAATLAKGMSLEMAVLMQTLLSRGVLAAVGVGLIGMVVFVVKRAPREARPR